MGWTWETAFVSSGISLFLTLEVAEHETMTCSIESMEVSQSLQAGLSEGWSIASLSLVRKSQVRNFRWRRSFLASWVVEMLWRTWCGRPDRFSCQIVTFVLTVVSQVG